MIPQNLLKGSLSVIASGAGGFYLGGRYVGHNALPGYIGEPPQWLLTVQSTMWAMLVICAICVILWIIVDYRGDSA